MHVAFRTDASTHIGHGHVIRCLTLADALRARGARCLFICRPFEGNLIEKIRHASFEVAALPTPAAWTGEQEGYTHWLGAEVQEDAAQTLAVLPGEVDWVVVDHYAIGAAWEVSLRNACRRLLVIDDLANRNHNCDLLVDQNAGRAATDYDSLVPDESIVIAGPTHALLRPEFSVARERSVSRIRKPLRRLLVSMGGVDRGNISTLILESLNTCQLPPDMEITVVLGKSAPWIESVKQMAATMHWPTTVAVDATNMADLMADADLSIGAGGVSALERCCVGLPSLLIPTAANQLNGAIALAASGAAMLTSLDGTGAPRLQDALAEILNGSNLERMSEAAALITSGEGTDALASRMLSELGILLRPMEAGDLNRVLGWRNAPSVRRWMLRSDEITPEEHAAWFSRCSTDQDRRLLIAEADGAGFGFVQFACRSDGSEAEWGFYLAPGAPKGSGKLLGKLALEYAFRQLGLARILGRTLANNDASARFHENLGFRPTHHQGSATTPDSAMKYFEILRRDWESLQGACL